MIDILVRYRWCSYDVFDSYRPYILTTNIPYREAIFTPVISHTVLFHIVYPPHRTIIPYHQHTISYTVIFPYSTSTKSYHHIIPTNDITYRTIPYPSCTKTTWGAQPYENTRRTCLQGDRAEWASARRAMAEPQLHQHNPRGSTYDT